MGLLGRTRAPPFIVSLNYDDGGSVTFARRERPELLFDEKTGHPTFLVTGVVDPRGHGGKEDRSWTLVQPVGGRKGLN